MNEQLKDESVTNDAATEIPSGGPVLDSSKSTSAGRHHALDSVVDSLIDLGTQWASFGLRIGKQALEHSANTLSFTAKTLGAVAEGLDSKR